MKIDASRVRQLRQERQWSQEQLADACGVNLRTVQRLEAEGRASTESLRALAAVFEVAPEDLVGSSVPEASPPSALRAMRTELFRFDDFQGRSGRFEYWWFVLGCALVLAIGTLLHVIAYGVLAAVLLVPLVAAGTRRLRDAGESPWWQLLWLVPVAGLVVLWLQTRPTAEAVQPGVPASG